MENQKIVKGICPPDCDWGDWGDVHKSCPLHGSAPEAFGPNVTFGGCLAPSGGVVAVDAGDGVDATALEAPALEREPEVIVYSLDGIRAAKPGTPWCPPRRLISILGAGASDRIGLQPGWEDVLSLRFDDVEAPCTFSERGKRVEATLFSEDNAAAICDFLEKDPDADIAVHCAAGISRSVAVAAFIYRVLGHGMVFRGGSSSEGTGNRLVYRMLVREWLARYGADVVDDVVASGLPRVMDSPILHRVVRVVEPAARPVGGAFSFGPRRPRFMEAWMRAEDRMRDPLKARSRKLRLRFSLRVVSPTTRALDRMGLGVGLRRIADGAWLVWSGAMDALAQTARKLAG